MRSARKEETIAVSTMIACYTRDERPVCKKKQCSNGVCFRCSIPLSSKVSERKITIRVLVKIL